MADQRLVRQANERRLLSLLCTSDGLTRSDAARRLALTRSTLTSIVDDLMERRLVSEMSAPAAKTRRKIGRPGVRLGLVPSGGYYVGIEVGVDCLRFALIDLCTKVVGTWDVTAPRHREPESIIRLIVDAVTRLKGRRRESRAVRAVAIALPGLISRGGVVLNLPIIGWRELDLKSVISAEVGLPCHLENSANAAAFAETYGRPDSASSIALYVKLGAGCGGALIAGGRPFRGAKGLGLEIGHIRVARDGPLCHCGARGCLETFVNRDALRRYYREAAGSQGSDSISDAELASLARDGAPAARAAVDTLLARLTDGLASLANLFNPTEIIVGGSLLEVLRPSLADMRTAVAAATVPGLPVPDVVAATIGEFAAAIGAARISHHADFDPMVVNARAT